MKKDVCRNILALLLFAISLNAYFATAAFVPYPSGGSLSEQEAWIINNPNNFNPDDESQKKAFAQAYKDGKVDLGNAEQRSSVEKYLTRRQESVSLSDRKMLGELVSHYAPGVKVSLEKGENINLIKENGRLFLISSDGEKHDFVSYGSFQIGGKKLDRMTSGEDGRIELGFGENSVKLKDTVLYKDEFGNFLLADGSIIAFQDKFGKIILDENKVSCVSKLCSFSLEGMNVELNSLGAFQSLGDRRFSVVDGTTRIGKDLLAGSYEFSAKSGNSGIDFGRRVELRKFSGGANDLKNSFIRVSEGDFGKVDVNTGAAEKSVIACFGCKDFPKNAGEYDGSINFKSESVSNCAAGNCGQKFTAEIADKIAVKFENDASHQGFDKLKVSYSNLGYDEKNNPKAFFRLESCDGCKVGDGQIAGVQTINGKWFSIENKYYDGENKIPQLRYKYVSTASQFVPYYKYMIANDEGITFADKDIYRSSMSEDFLRTGKFKSTQLLERDFGSKSLKKYMWEYSTDRSSGDAIEVDIKTNNLAREMFKDSNAYSRQIYVVDDTAFNLDSKGNVVNIPNLYVVNKDGSFVIDQIKNLDEYNKFFGIEENTLENFFNRNEKACSAIVDAQRGVFEENQKASALIRNLLKTFPVENARQCLGSYGERSAGAEQIDAMLGKGMSLSEIYQKIQTDSELTQARRTFNEPSVLLQLNNEEIKNSIAREEETVSIYRYGENGGILRDTVKAEDAKKLASSDAVNAYLRKDRDYFYNPLLSQRIQVNYVLGNLASQEDRQSFLKFIGDLESGRDGRILSSEDALPEQYVIGKSGVVEIKNKDSAKMLSEGKISREDIEKISDLDATFKGDQFNRDLKLFLEEIVPKTPAELALNIAPEIGTLAKSFVVLSKAEGIASTLHAAGLIGMRGVTAGLTGYAGASPAAASKFDEALIALRTQNIDAFTGIPINKGRQAYLDGLAGNVAERMGFAPEEVRAVGLDNKLFVQGQEKIPVDVVAFVHVNPATGEKTPLVLGTSYVKDVNGLSPQEQAANTIQALNRLDELGVPPYKFEGAYSHIFLDAQKNPVDGVMVITDIPKEILSSGKPDAAFEAFKESVSHLPQNERAAAIDAYNKCCRVTQVSKDASGFGPVSSADVAPNVIIGSSSSTLPENIKISDTSLGITATDTETGKKIGSLRYNVDENDPKHIVNIGTSVSQNYQGQGVQNAMFGKLLSKSDFNMITTNDLIDTNKNVFTKSLIDNLGSKYQLKDYSADGLPATQLYQCCSEVIKTLSKDELDAIVRKSLQNTPAYRSRVKYGFERICDHKFNFDTGANVLSVGFTVCK